MIFKIRAMLQKFNHFLLYKFDQNTLIGSGDTVQTMLILQSL